MHGFYKIVVSCLKYRPGHKISWQVLRFLAIVGSGIRRMFQGVNPAYAIERLGGRALLSRTWGVPWSVSINFWSCFGAAS